LLGASNRQPGDDEPEKRYGADDRKPKASGHGSPAQFFNQRGSIHAEKLGGAILVSVGAFEGLADEPSSSWVSSMRRSTP
jgi:hypothetical protein